MTPQTAQDLDQELYPDSDGQPMSDNTLQFKWIVTLQGNLDIVFRNDPDVFVAGDLLWYAEKGRPEASVAPDALVAFGRPKGYRGSYKQWEEGGIAPQVVYEVLSSNNRREEMDRKFRFYDEHGVEEYYLYDPDYVQLTGWQRRQGRLQPIAPIHGWVSPRLGVRFDLSGEELVVFRPDGSRFLTFLELERQREEAMAEVGRARQEAEQARGKAERLAAQLRALGVEPEAERLMLRLRYRGATAIPVEAECLTPDNLAGKSVAEIASLPVQYGNAPAPLGDFFQVEGDAGDGEVLIEGNCGRIKHIGAGMAGGRITVRGDVGMHLGAGMVGGEIHVHGRAGDWAGAEMRGGRIHVRGDAGHLAGAAYRGGLVGMRGGVLFIEGSAGNEIGGNMRRGLIAVGGDAGDFTGVALIAGSIFVFGKPGLRPGAGMKRGTLAFAGGTPGLLPSFRYDCDYRPVVLSLYLRQLRAWGFPVPHRAFGGTWRRYSGDLLTLGKGEVLHRRDD